MNGFVRALAPWAGAGLLLIASGCGVGGQPQPTDSEQARAALRAALDSWKAGEKPEVLARQSPAIHVKDVDWDGGFRLVAYRADADGRLVGYDMNYPVVLELKSPRGVAVKKNAVYTVTTRNEVFISRQEG
jgi:hypothetical protein